MEGIISILNKELVQNIQNIQNMLNNRKWCEPQSSLTQCGTGKYRFRNLNAHKKKCKLPTHYLNFFTYERQDQDAFNQLQLPIKHMQRSRSDIVSRYPIRVLKRVWQYLQFGGSMKASQQEEEGNE